MGIHSLSDDVPLKIANFSRINQYFEEKIQYSQWMFVYQPRPAGKIGLNSKTPFAQYSQTTGTKAHSR